MRVNLICSESIKSILSELFLSRGIEITEEAQLCVVEAGQRIPPDNLAIIFKMNNINQLLEILERLSRHNDDNNSTITGKAGEDRYEIISYDNICFFESRGNNVFCITAKSEYRIKEKLYELEGRLPEDRFIRVSKSFIVNVTSVKEIIPWFGRRLVLKFINCDKEVEVSRSFTKNFKEFIGM